MNLQNLLQTSPRFNLQLSSATNPQTKIKHLLSKYKTEIKIKITTDIIIYIWFYTISFQTILFNLQTNHKENCCIHKQYKSTKLTAIVFTYEFTNKFTNQIFLPENSYGLFFLFYMSHGF